MKSICPAGPELRPIDQNQVGMGASSELPPPCISPSDLCNEEKGRSFPLPDLNTVIILHHLLFLPSLSS